MKGYEMVENRYDYGVKFYFISSGNRNVMKLVDIESVRKLEKNEVYNLGFGVYDFGTTGFDDSSRTENSDGRKVLNTVLNAIQRFFDLYPTDMLIIQGSDSNPQFKMNCKLNCSRKCGNSCLKFKQRIRIYRNYLDKRFKELSVQYEFFGGYEGGMFSEKYIPGKEYDSILIIKKLSYE
jgi:hypothetical protein